MTLHVGSTQLALGNAVLRSRDGVTGNAFEWSSAGFNWDSTSTAVVSLVAPGQAQSSDATLSALTASKATSATGTFSALSIGTFAAATETYTANVANDVTHVKLTPTVNESNATVKVGKGTSLTSVTSGSASGAIALGAAGTDTAVKVEVTAQDSTKKTYTVTVSRATAQSQSSDATLSALTASKATSATGTFSSLSIGTFAAATTSYTASVANDVTHVKLTPTVNESNATVKVGKGTNLTAVTSGSASGAIALSVGSNAITVEVTAQDSTKKTYTVTVSRATAQSQSSDATLSALTASKATSATGTFSSLSIGTFAAATTSYTASVANDVTHVKLTPTVNESNATVKVGKGTNLTAVTSGSASGAIALSVGSNAITVEVTAQDSTKKTYTVTVTRAAAVPTVSLSVTPNPVTEGSSATVRATLSAAHTADVTIPVTVTAGTAETGDYTALTSITILSGTTSNTGSVTANQDTDTDDETFTVSLGTLPSAVTAGSPSSVTVTIADDDTTPRVFLSATPNPVAEGSDVTVTATLTAALTNAVSIPVTVTRGTAESGDLGSLTSIAIPSGATTGTGTVSTSQDADPDDETFTVALGSSLPSGVVAGTPSSVTVTIDDDDTATGAAATVELLTNTNAVLEGEPVKVRALLSGRLGYEVTIPVTVTPDTAEPGDHGSVTSITVPGNTSLGEATVTTVRDADRDDERFTVSLGEPLPAAVTAGRRASARVRIMDRDKLPPSAAKDLAVAPGDGRLALTWTEPVPGPIAAHYEVSWKTQAATNWGSAVQARGGGGYAYTITGLANGTAYDVRVRRVLIKAAEDGGGWDYGAWAPATGVPMGPGAPSTLTLSVDPGRVTPGAAVTVTARLDAPARQRLDVVFRITGDGGAARLGMECSSAGAHGAVIFPGRREASVQLCTAGVAAGRTVTVTAETLAPALTAKGIAVRMLGGNPPTALSLSAAPAVGAGGGTTTVTVRLDRPSPFGMTVQLSLPIGLGAAQWGSSCTPPDGTWTGLHAVTVPPGGQAATATLCVLPGAARVTVMAYVEAPRLVATLAVVDAPGRASTARELALTTLELTAPAARTPVALAPGTNRYTVEVPKAVATVTVTPRAADPNAVVTVTSPASAPGAGTGEVALTVGETTPVTVEVRAADGRAVRTYTLTVRRAEAQQGPARQGLARPAACTAATGPLCGIALTAGSATVALSPAFAPGTKHYQATVPAGTSRVSLTPTWGGTASVFARAIAPWHEEATHPSSYPRSYTKPTRVKPSGTAVALTLAPSGRATALVVMVFGADRTKTEYEIEVTEARPAQSPDATLRALAGRTSEDGRAFGGALTLSPAFAPGTTAYTATVGHAVTHATLTPTTTHTGATVTVGAAAVRSGAASDALALAVGDTALTVAVTAQDGTTTTYTVTVTRAGPPLTAAFERVPTAHDGTAPFWLNVRFSEALGTGGTGPTAASFAVKPGKVKRVRQLEPGLWRVRLVPASWRDLTVTLAGGRACDATGAVCTTDGRALTTTSRTTIGGPVRLKVKDGKAREGRDATLDFAVTLNRAATQTVTVDYATQDGTATAGTDYTATSGTLTFAPGETAQTVAVPLLDDAHDEGKETFVLTLSNPQGAYLRNMHRRATGTIKNDDPLQRAWLSRFGRTAATHVTDAVSARLRETPGEAAHVTIGGYQLPLGKLAAGQPAPDGTSEVPDAATTVLTDVARVLGLGPGTGRSPDTPWVGQPDPRLNHARPLPTFRLREVLQNSAFRLSLNATDAGTALPRLTAWGRFAGTTFDGQEHDLTLDGDVFTGTVGVDGTWDRWLAGVAVAHSQGTGGYTQPVAANGQGALEQTLTSIHPYLRYAVTDRLNVWGTVGYGWGQLDLEMKHNGTVETVETDTDLVMGAFGGRGVLLAPADTGGVTLATRTDAMLTRTTSDAVTGPTGNLAAHEADAHRLRVVLEGSRAVTWADGRSLTPTLELGVRHDWGDAETGFGVELGGRVAYADPRLGLTIDGTVRALLAHEDSDYQEWGASGTIRLAPGAAGQGLALTVAPSWGVTGSGVEGLWARQTTQGLAPMGTQPAPGGRVQADVGYGVPAFDTGVLTPYAGTVLGDGTAQSYRVGTRLQVPGPGATGLTVDLAGTRQEPTGAQPVNQGLSLQATWGF